jgi:hypothetical protein
VTGRGRSGGCAAARTGARVEVDRGRDRVLPRRVNDGGVVAVGAADLVGRVEDRAHIGEVELAPRVGDDEVEWHRCGDGVRALRSAGEGVRGGPAACRLHERARA